CRQCGPSRDCRPLNRTCRAWRTARRPRPGRGRHHQHDPPVAGETLRGSWAEGICLGVTLIPLRASILANLQRELTRVVAVQCGGEDVKYAVAFNSEGDARVEVAARIVILAEQGALAVEEIQIRIERLAFEVDGIRWPGLERNAVDLSALADRGRVIVADLIGNFQAVLADVPRFGFSLERELAHLQFELAELAVKGLHDEVMDAVRCRRVNDFRQILA